MKPHVETDYSGMTTNERLFVAGLMDEFDAAVATRDRGALIRLLRRVDICHPEATADAILRRSHLPM